MTILDAQGRPISSQPQVQEAAAVQLRGGQMPAGPGLYLEPGWREGVPWDGLSGRPVYGRYGLSRAQSRQTCRALYFTNGLYQAAVDITGAFLVGDAIRYGTFADAGLQSIVDDFWQLNNMEQLISERLITEWFLDGEIGVVFPSGEEAPRPDQPARIGMLDVDHSGFRLEFDTARGAIPGDMVQELRLELQDREVLRWGEGEFAWAANGGMWNDPRGWPVAQASAEACVAYIAMMNMRLNVHYVQQRVLAVYKAILDPDDVDAYGQRDGGVFAWRRKTAGFRRLPQDGGILPIVTRAAYTDPQTQRSYAAVEEDLKFLQPGQGAADAASDMKLILRLIGLTIGGLPEHYLGEGGGVTRTTAASMGLPSVRLANKRQAALKALLTRIFRTEVKRRAGPDARFKVNKGSRKRQAIDLIEFPWVFPEIREESLEEIVKRVALALKHGLIAEETAQADLGYDPALEAERRAGRAPKPPPSEPTSPKEKP